MVVLAVVLVLVAAVVVVVGAFVAVGAELLLVVLLSQLAPFVVFLGGFLAVESSRRQNRVAELRIVDGGLVQGWMHDLVGNKNSTYFP